MRHALIRNGLLAAIAIVAGLTSVYASASARSRAHSAVGEPDFVRTAGKHVVPARCRETRRLAVQAERLAAPSTTVRLVKPLRQTPRLGQGGYVFPVLGALGVGDTFGAARAGVSWHHGDDLFAPRGTPVLAVADGVVFSVGWQRLGGRRLWLRDSSGNEFYYAHLNGYSAAAAAGRRVRAGVVLGFVGSSGDAEHTPAHLHFEIHPGRLLALGYDGAVDPTTYLEAWRHVLRPMPDRRLARSQGCGVSAG